MSVTDQKLSTVIKLNGKAADEFSRLTAKPLSKTQREVVLESRQVYDYYRSQWKKD
jgi:hypothetical protein